MSDVDAQDEPKQVEAAKRQRLGVRRTVHVFGVMLEIAFTAARGRAASLLGLYLLIGLQGAFGAYLMRPIVDALAAGDAAQATTFTALFLGVLIAGTIANDLLQVLQTDLADRMTHELDRRLMAVIAGVPGVEHLEDPVYADRLKQIRERQWVPSQILQSLNSVTYLIAGLTASAVLLGSVHPALALLPLLMAPSFWLQARAHRKRFTMWDEAVPASRLADHLLKLTHDPVGAKEIRLFGLRDHILREHVRLSREWIANRARVRAKQELGALAGQFLYAGALAGAVAVLGRLALDGRASFGDVALGIQAARLALGHVEQSARVVATLSETAFAADRYVWLLGYQPAVRVRPDPLPAPARIDHLRFEGVTFRYPGTQTDVLRDVHLEIPAGAIVAVVGENGAGKSSLIKLLARMYDPTSGRIVVDGVDLRDLDLVGWRDAMASSFQDFAKFELIASETVGVGDLPAIDDRSRVEAAVTFAGADRIVDKLPGGFDAQLGRRFEDGHDLSEGEWQRLALARGAMRVAPAVVILDEPTAALDARAEHEVFASFAALAAGDRGARPITVLVSHRFSTVRMADLIVVLHHGAVEEIGSHAELMARGGRYAELFNLQASRYD